ncbi:hypothetical protein BDM02DRAFT_1364337 [Thelephora ganbajun]|uniref:Uncharacterized protein n=1 Tax=Thelephora ganbajun TaxID=370292 RepID=A0ACB6Z295_THEGA|nr:hypothetical protein BDM02DRAFT_1364337 [Thelephora ganbajun]
MWNLLFLAVPFCLYLFLRPRPIDPRPMDPRQTNPRPTDPHPADDYKRFLIGPRPYALVTEATGDMGKILVKELYDTGLNLIIHGRNEEEILSVIDELKKTSSPDRDVRYFVMDARTFEMDVWAILRKFEGLNVTVLAKCAGMGYNLVPTMGEDAGLVSGLEALHGTVPVGRLFYSRTHRKFFESFHYIRAAL